MQAVSTFDSTKTDLRELLAGARDGETQLPDFQRGWVWDDDHVRDLIASVSRAFPIGTVMLLEAGGELSVRTRPLEGANPRDVAPDELILDGQQRLTSLFQSLMSGQPVATRDPKGNPVNRWYYIDIDKALDESADREEAVVSVPEERQVRSDFGRAVDLDLSSRPAEYEAKMFPLIEVFDHWKWAQGFREHYGHNPAVSRLWDEFEREVVQRIQRYQLPIIRLHKQTPKEAVCLVFEKVNTGGVELSVFELLTATFAAVAPPEFQLRADWESRQQRLREHPVLREVANTDLIQVITLLATRDRRLKYLSDGNDPERAPAISCKRRDMLRLTYDEYDIWADQVTAAFGSAARFLHRECIYETKFLPYGSQLVPLTAILAVLGDEGIENPSIRNKLARWYWCGVFGELYGSTTETRFARDLPDVLSWTDDGPEPRTVAEANFAPDRLLTLRTRRSAAYKGLYALLVREGAQDFRTGEAATDQSYFDESIDIHHIFPKKWCRERRPEPVPAHMYDSIVNKTPLTARTNRIVGGRAPSDYLRSLRTNHGVSPDEEKANLASHLIDRELLALDGFDSFFDARRTALLRQIEHAMGKATLPDPTEPPPSKVTYDTLGLEGEASSAGGP